MNLQLLLEKAFIPLLLTTIFIVAFELQFPHIYSYLIEHFKDEKLSILYAHLFIYNFLSLSIFSYFLILINKFLIKSYLFIGFSMFMLLIFYGLSYRVIIDSLNYFIDYPLSSNAIMGMILFIVSSFGFVIYSLTFAIIKKNIPLSHATLFFLFAVIYSAFFIDKYCYPISELIEHIIS